MLLFLNLYQNEVLVRARAEGPGMIGDLEHYVTPGERFCGIPYDVLRSAGDGAHELESLQALAAAATANKDKGAP